MRTMYIILASVGWGWFALAIPLLAYALRRRPDAGLPPDPASTSTPPVAPEADSRP